MDISVYKGRGVYTDSFCDFVSSVMKDDPANLNNVYFINTVLLGNRGKASRTRFFQAKRFLLSLYELMRQDGLVSDASIAYIKGAALSEVVGDKAVTTRMFRDLDTCLNFIDGVSKHNDGDNTSGYIVKAIIILNWYGFSTDEIISIKKSDFMSRVRVIKKGSEAVLFGEREYKELLAYRNASEYKEIVTGRVSAFANSDFLMRGVESKGVSSFGLYTVRCRVSTFSRYCEKEGKAIDIPKLRRNAIYCKMHDSGVQPDDFLKAYKSLVGTKQIDYERVKELKSEYTAWLRRYYNG